MMLEPESLLPKTEAEVDGWKKTFKDQYTLVGLLEGNFQSYFVAHEVPKEIVSGKPAVDPDPGAGNPFGNFGEESKDPAKSVSPGGDDPGEGDVKKDAADPKKDEKSDGAKKDEKAEDAKKDGGGPRVDGQDVPGGGLVQAQDAPPAPAPTPNPAPAPAVKPADGKPADGAAKKPDEKAEPAKPFEYLKKSTASGKILVIGSSDFASDGSLQGSVENAVLIQNAAGYMATDGLTGLRAKRLADRPFDPPSDTAKDVATALGWFASPLLLLVLLVVVYTWRRVWRPAASRRRMAAAQAR
jgi:hypothetical protein